MVSSQTIAAFNALMSGDPLKSGLTAQQQQAAMAALLGGAAAVGSSGDSVKRESNSPASGAENSGSV